MLLAKALVVLQMMTSLVNVQAEVFSALADMEVLLNTEKELVEFLNNFISMEELLLQRIRMHLQDFQKQWSEASKDIPKFLHNPVNAYLLIKGLTRNWNEVESLLSSSADFVEQFMQKKASLTFPTEQDLTGSAAAVCRLQDTYNLKTSDLARGEIQGIEHASELKSGDCFEIGRQAFNFNDQYHAMLWLQEALDRFEKETNASVSVIDILEYLAFSTYTHGNYRHALKLTNDILKLAPNHSGAQYNREYYTEAIAKAEAENAGAAGGVTPETITIKKSFEAYPGKDVYEKLCRGENTVDSSKDGRLGCRYVGRNQPFYMLQPIKEEDLAMEPHIVFFHDIISDGEIEIIKNISGPKLKRAGVYNNATGKIEAAFYRTSKSAWLESKDHPVVTRLDQRLEAATGLTMETAEHLQVGNYGIGGHYEPHFDFITSSSPEFKEMATGNRIATALFYLSDVDAGGATVFPEVGVAVIPKKGSAVFWYNLHRNGDGDRRTRHAACPVLAGNKWVANKWIHERQQEFRRPCGLNQWE